MTLFLSSTDFSFYKESSLEWKHGGPIAGFVNGAKFGSLDPGGYSALLSLWSMISVKTFWLRSLSSFFSEMLMNLSYTLRPYSMEVCGTCFLVYFIENFKNSSQRMKVTLMLLLGFFLGGRYFFWFPAALVLLGEYIYSNEADRRALLKASTVVLIFLPFYFFSLFHQLGAQHLAYLEPLYFFGSKNQNMEYSVLISFLCFPAIFFINKLNTDDSATVEHSKINFLLLTFFLISILADLLHLSPFNLATKYTVSFRVLSLVSLSYYFVEPITLIYREFLSIRLVLLPLPIAFLLNSPYLFKQDSRLVPIIHHLKENYSKETVVYCSRIMFDSVYFLKNIVKVNYSWNQIPTFRRIEEFKNLEEDRHSLFLTEITQERALRKALAGHKTINVFEGFYEQLYLIKKAQ